MNVMWPVEPVSDNDDSEDGVDESSWQALPTAEKLHDVLSCLRSRHLYCFFCGCEVGHHMRVSIESILVLHDCDCPS